MKRYLLKGAVLAAILSSVAAAQEPPPAGSYHLTGTVTPGGDGGWDYLVADAADRKLYIPRGGPAARISVYDLDSLKSVGEIPGVNAHGVAIDPASHHGFASSKPVLMWDTRTQSPIKRIAVQGSPDGIFFDPFNARVYVFSHSAPNATIIDAASGAVLGTVDLGGMPEQAASDGQGRVYVALEDKDQVAVLDAAAMKVVAHYDLDGVGSGPAGLALDAKNHVLFVACHNETMVYLDAQDGKFLYALPIGAGVDGAAFNPDSMDIFSAQGDGTLTIARESAPGAFDMVGTVMTAPGARTMAFDSKTNRIILAAARYAPPAAGQAAGRGPMVPGSFALITVSK